MNVVFVSHCDFTGNSAMHLFSIANELSRSGIRSAVCVPSKPETIEGHGAAHFQVLDHQQAASGGVSFADGKGPDLVHAWTPRESVRQTAESLVQRYRCPYFVHLEDNEEAIVADELSGTTWEEFSSLPAEVLDALVPVHRSHPVRYREFLSHAAGVTVLMDRLLEFKPERVPGLVFWPGFEDAFARPVQASQELRRRIGARSGEKILVYTGNIHNSNVGEVRSLYLAVAALRRRGLPVKLVKTGWNYADPWWPGSEGTRDMVVDLGFLPREDLAPLLSLADVLVQPGSANRFNDYRFPSKLPEFLASGKPVVLPKTNIGRFLRDGEEAVLLQEGHALEIAEKIEALLREDALRAKVGKGGRAFALRELSWDRNVGKLKAFYEEVLARPPTRGHESDGAIDDQIDGHDSVIPVVAQAPEVSRRESPLLAKLVAFYLPQYHPIPENDRWWGKGFTEWTNVARARPNFEGHLQPRLPADLGFYDLRVPEVMDEQAALAKRYGIHGFCFYYYWFDGARLLERPLDQWLQRRKPDFPFCICWANENWSRRWDGSEAEVLMEQKYLPGWEEKLVRDVLPFLRDPRYIKVGNAPLLLVYRVAHLPEPARSADRIREACRKEGIDSIHLGAVQSFGIGDPRPYGCDSAVEFVPPHTDRQLIDPRQWRGVSPDFKGHLESYPAVMRRCLEQPLPDYPWYRCANPAWDNTPRRGNRAHVLVDSSPELYERWLRTVVEQSLDRMPGQEPLVFINAWNEWAEGAYLEPDNREGHARLEATQRAARDAMVTWLRRRGVQLEPARLEQVIETRVPASRVVGPG